MDDMRLKFSVPITTGAPQRATMQETHANTAEAGSKSTFRSVLEETIQKNSTVNFSKHAVKRAADHGIELTEDSLQRLGEGVRIANDRNLEDTLILVGTTAFLVNAKNNTVITALSGNDMKGNVFTNIEGTVII
ncbi:MAG: hypothetical protein ABT01_01465 [Clostridium sp. SCN 57-10]|nr:MAG: hypothetical protein ABT01_01465 [Clostridium sp. SCN 57-10]